MREPWSASPWPPDTAARASRRLLDAYIQYGREHLAFLTLEVRAGNAPAIALYEKLGFREVGRRKNYYRAEHEDALLMTVEFDRHG